MKLLVTIPICREDAQRAEILLDLIYQLDGKTTQGAALLVFAPEVHQEMRDKLKITASLAFSTVDVFDIKQLFVADKEKLSAVWSMFNNVAQHIAHNYRWPWLWLEPDCMPVQTGWRKKIADAYETQPRRYLSRWMKSGETMFCHRVGVYPVNILGDIEAANVAKVPFEVSIVNLSTKCDLFQQVAITSADEVHKIRQDAVLIHHDKAGVLADWVRKSINKEAPAFTPEPTEAESQPRLDAPIEPQNPFTVNGKRRGRPPKVQPVTV